MVVRTSNEHVLDTPFKIILREPCRSLSGEVFKNRLEHKSDCSGNSPKSKIFSRHRPKDAKCSCGVQQRLELVDGGRNVGRMLKAKG
jgi:hypothetical protein